MNVLHHLRHWFLPHESNNQRAKLLHPSSVAGLIVIFLLFQFLLHSTSQFLPQVLGYASQIPPADIVRLTNVERQRLNLPLLTLDSQLSAAAARKAADMFARNYWAHVSPIGTQPWAFITDAGYSYRYAGENLARDFADPQSVVNAWMASPSHRDNLLSNRYQDIGVAVMDGTLDGHDTTLVVQMFGTRLSAAARPQVGNPASIQVQAAGNQPLPTSAPVMAAHNYLPAPSVSPFDVTKTFTLVLLGLFSLVLAVDLILANRRSLVRWTSKSFAHFIFIVIMMVAAAALIRGQII